MYEEIDEEQGKVYELEQVSVRLKLTREKALVSLERLDHPTKIIDLVARELSDLDREYFCVINMDVQGRALNFNVVSIGNTSETVVPIQNVFKSAILSNASSIIMLHNHPSGSMRPSEQDFSLTCRLVRAAKLMGIPIEDHIIVGGGSGLYTSMMTEFPELFVDAKSNLGTVAEKYEQGASYVCEEPVSCNRDKDELEGMCRNHENREKKCWEDRGRKRKSSLRKRLREKIALAAEQGMDKQKKKELVLRQER